MGPKRIWDDARAKCEREGGCRICGAEPQAAHVTGRRYDRPKEGRKTLYVHPDSIVPLCEDHHTAYDAHALDLLPFVFLPEQLRAVADLGGIELARKRLAPSAYNKEVSPHA